MVTFDSDAGVGRRAFLAGTAGSLTALAGCTGVLQSSDGGTTNGDETTNGGGTTNVGGTTPSEVSGPLVTASDETSYGIDFAGNPVMGSSDAPVDVYYWSDYQCPFCRRFEQQTFPKLLKNYVRQGKIRFVVLEYPNIGEASKTAARMSKCVWRQVREDDPVAFKRWHSTMFDEQEKPNSGWAKTENLLDITANVEGVDASKVESCLKNDTKSVKKSVAADKEAGSSKGVQATPSFIFDDPTSNDLAPMIEGAQPYRRFESVIQKAKK
jgi:protein-disulfide isomerase